MWPPSAGVAHTRPPARTRTLVASNCAVWIWPGIPLTVRRGAEIIPVAAATIRFWIARLHGPDALHKELVWAVCEAISRLSAGDESAAQRTLDSLGLTALSVEGAAFAAAVVRHVAVHLPDVAAVAKYAHGNGSSETLRALLLAQPLAFEQLVKGGPWDSSKHPRWPAGAPDSQGGRFAPSDSSGGAPPPDGPPPGVPPLVVTSRKPPPGIGHNQGPPLEEPPEIPQEPLSGGARTTFIKLAVRWLETALAISDPEARVFLSLLQASSWILEQCYPYIAAFFTPPKTLRELQDDANFPAKGYDIHHIVERAQAAAEGIPKSVWDAPENRVRIPTLKHWEITRWYMTPDEECGGLSPRDYLRGKSWDEKYRVGRRALIKFKVLRP